MTRPNYYAGAALDRAAHRRKDAAWLAEALAAPQARFLPLWRSQSLFAIARDSEAFPMADAAWWGEPPGVDPVPLHLTAAEDWWREVPGAEPVLLGLEGEAVWFALDLSAVEAPEAHPALGRGRFCDMRRVGPLLPHAEGSRLAYARGLLWWHQRHRFCGVCGAATVSAEAGHVRRCTNADCGTPHFPRTDPAVIMLVTDGDRCLLGRQAAWPAGMVSTLAGFVEPGESLEEAVAREVFEEVGVRVADVRYHSSQPWPFPSSLMLGFTAVATDATLTLDRDEIEDARWFDREALRRAGDGEDGLRLPRRDSIARRLIEDWLAAG
ncbi:MAG TPA: NAD(+) diphosphatase [Alphaproteobacteria bacterium]|nr:NAD(+) diphosphatase [Alphaproteobacteria bacterium]